MSTKHVMTITTWQDFGYAGFDIDEGWFEDGKEYPERKLWIEKLCRYEESFHIHCQCNPGKNDSRMYGESVTIEAKTNWNDIEAAKRNIGKLAKIHKAYTELTERLGYPKTFAQFVAYIAQITKCEIVEHKATGYQSVSVYELENKERNILAIPEMA